jgi:hypothetical protein
MNFLGVMATIPTIERKISKSLATPESCETKLLIALPEVCRQN